jgi:hypothetical protein
MIHAPPFETAPKKVWRISRMNGQCAVEEADFDSDSDFEPDENTLILRTFPAYHSEVASGDKEDTDGLNGNAVSCFFVQSRNWGILFTGDTESPLRTERWSGKAVKLLEKKTTVLISNMKTIEYLKKSKDKKEKDQWDCLHETSNQLGFEGTKQLALRLKPKALVMRALGLECVVEKENSGILRYAPQQLAIIREAMELSLRERLDEKDRPEFVVIPGKHMLSLTEKSGNGVVIQEKIIVPAFSKTGIRKFGQPPSKSDGNRLPLFVTSQRKLADEIDDYIKTLKNDWRKGKNFFMVIQGETGGGKSLLAEAIAMEILEKGSAAKDKIRHYDLATAGIGANFGAELFGWNAGSFTDAKSAFEGYLGIDGGVVILNQLERLDVTQSSRFLDLLEERRYRRLGSNKDFTTEVRIIFTTNIDIDASDSPLREDMRNRLRPRCLSLPRLSHLPQDEKEREISTFVMSWCDREQAILDSEANDILFRLDYGNGSFRMLNELLHKARRLTLTEYGAIEKALGGKAPSEASPLVFIETKFIRKAMDIIGIGFGKSAPSSKGIPRDRALILAVWLSHFCEKKKTYQSIKGPKGGTMGARAFGKILSEFAESAGSAEKAWEFFDDANGLKELEAGKNIEEYVEGLHIAEPSQSSEIDRIFHVGSDDEAEGWKKERSENLANLMRRDKDRLRKKFLKGIGSDGAGQ